MKKILITLLFIISSSICAFATEPSKSSVAVEDPDLKLSIEELKKKYPIDWFDKKYGEYHFCEGDGDIESPAEGWNSNRVCGFTSDPNKVHSDELGLVILFDPFKELSEAHLKSVIINYAEKSEYDVRPDHIVVLIIKIINDPNNQTLLTKKIRNFLYSDKILSSYNDLSCEVLENFDPNNNYYDDLAVGYFRAKYLGPYGIKDNSMKSNFFEDLLQRCITPSKISSIRVRLLEEFKSKIKK